MTKWSWQGEMYEGCAETPDWPGNDWCYVQGGSNCPTALNSTLEGEDKLYRECSACNCMTKWSWQGEMYEGCAETPDWPGTDWCYVQGGSNCPTAVASTLEGEDKMYTECSASPAKKRKQKKRQRKNRKGKETKGKRKQRKTKQRKTKRKAKKQ